MPRLVTVSLLLGVLLASAVSAAPPAASLSAAAPPAAAPPAAAPPAAGAAGVFALESLNRRYDHLAPDLLPFASGPFQVQLSSPEHQLDLVSNRLVLRPEQRGVYGLALQLEFTGQGRLLAELTVAGARSRFEDLLTVPTQLRTVLGRVRIARSPAGYLVTPIELPKTFGVEIQSRVGQQLVAACKSLAILGFGASCEELARAFAQVQVPLPGPGETYLIERSRLSEAECRRLDAFLEATGAVIVQP